jgi:hypothetical protein
MKVYIRFHSIDRIDNLPMSRKIKIIQTGFSIVLLIILITIPVYYSWPEPSKGQITAVKLNLRVLAESEAKISIIVSAVDETGNLDPTRDDEVELSFESVTTSKLAHSRVRLENGSVRVGLEVVQKETSILMAKWISGLTPLRDAKILVSPLMWDY